MRDPERDPRFPLPKVSATEEKGEERREDNYHSLSPKKPMKKVPHFVNMDKQSGRADREREDHLILEDLEETPDVTLAIEVERQKEANIKAAKEGKSSKKGIPSTASLPFPLIPSLYTPPL